MDEGRIVIRKPDPVSWGLSVKTAAGPLRRLGNVLTWRIRYVLFGELRW